MINSSGGFLGGAVDSDGAKCIARRCCCGREFIDRVLTRVDLTQTKETQSLTVHSSFFKHHSLL